MALGNPGQMRARDGRDESETGRAVLRPDHERLGHQHFLELDEDRVAGPQLPVDPPGDAKIGEVANLEAEPHAIVAKQEQFGPGQAGARRAPPFAGVGHFCPRSTQLATLPAPGTRHGS